VLEEAVATKAERADMLSAVSNLQAGLGQKAGRNELEQALARKLDIRTFLASHASPAGAQSGFVDRCTPPGVLLPQQSTISRQSTATLDPEPGFAVSSGRQLPPTPGIIMRQPAPSTLGSTAGDLGSRNSRAHANSTCSVAHSGLSLLTPQATPGSHLVRNSCWMVRVRQA
jgi:hypothetical protein